MGTGTFWTRRLATAVFAMMGVTACVSSTRAAVEVVSVEEPPIAATYVDRQVEIPKFDPLLGSLQSVTIDLRGTGEFVQDSDGFSFGHRRSSDSVLHLVLETANDKKLISLTQSAEGKDSRDGAEGKNRREGDLPERGTTQVTVEGQKTLNSPKDLMQFTGSGLVDLFLSAEANESSRFRAKCFSEDGLWRVGADIEVIYTFSPIPEVSTWLACGFAMLALVLPGLRRGHTPKT